MLYPKETSKQKARFGIYECVCGKNLRTRTADVKTGHTKSCGCQKNTLITKSKIKHNGKGTRLYRIWKDMNNRTTNPNNSSFEHYGKKGIVVCNEWKDFVIFKEWALSNGYNNTLTIDRINNDGNYEPNNCRWVAMTVQARNKTKLISTNTTGYRGIIKTKKKFQAAICVDYKNIHLGTFETKEEAARAYDDYVTKHNLEHTKNFN